jgi:peptide/nickel transport system permease protein
MAQDVSEAPVPTFPVMRPRRSRLQALMRLTRREPVMMGFFAIIIFICLVATFGPMLPIQKPQASDFTVLQQAPSSAHWFGTDWLGRDLFSQMVHGARTSLMVGVGAILLGSSIGLVWGVLSGFAGGKFDLVSQRVIEVLMAFPAIILALSLAAVLQNRGLFAGPLTVIIAIALTRVGQTARLIRGVAISTMPSPHVDAARAIGAGWLRIAVRHVAPSTIAPFLVISTAHLGGGILAEATLGFLGVGVPPPTPSWGALLSGSLSLASFSWWLTVIPGVLITILVLAFNIAGDGLRDTLDPRLRGTR